jgi:DNA replication protein DnaC
MTEADLKPEQVPVYERLLKACSQTERGPVVLLIGPPGVGKSVLLSLLCARAKRMGRVYMQMADFFMAWKGWYSAPEADASTNRKLIRTVPLLVLDDAQMVTRRDGMMSEDEHITLSAVVGHRHNEQLRTVICGNFTPDQAEAWLGAALMDRVADGGDLIVCDWPSYRGRS